MQSHDKLLRSHPYTLKWSELFWDVAAGEGQRVGVVRDLSTIKSLKTNNWGLK